MPSIGEVCAKGLTLWVSIAGLFGIVGLLIRFFGGSIGKHDGRCGNDSSGSPCRSAWID